MVREDSQNLGVYRLEKVFVPKKKDKEWHYQFKGFYSTLIQAIEYIQLNGLLMDEKEMSDLYDHKFQVDRANERILEEVRDYLNESI